MKLRSEFRPETVRGFRAFPDAAIRSARSRRFARAGASARPARTALRWPDGHHVLVLDAAANRLARARFGAAPVLRYPSRCCSRTAAKRWWRSSRCSRRECSMSSSITDYPADRLRCMLADSGATTMVCDAAHHAQACELCGRSITPLPFDKAQEAPPACAPLAAPGPDSLAVILIRQARPGRPKGIAHASQHPRRKCANHSNGLRRHRT